MPAMIRLALPLMLLALVPGALQAQETGRVAGPSLTVTGRATVEVAPDVATVAIGVSARAPSAGAAIDEVSAAASRIVAAASGFGIDRQDIWTSQLALQPVFRTVREESGAGRQPDGFEATDSVQVRIRDLGRIGEFLRKGVGEGATRVGGLTFGLLDRGKAEREAGTAAAADAQLRGEALAAAAGVKLGRVIRASWSDRAGPGPLMRGLAAGALPVAVEPGLIPVSAEVEMTWTLERGP